MRLSTLLAALFLFPVALLPGDADAVPVPVEVSVEAWRTTDGSFAFSAIHGATSAKLSVDLDGDGTDEGYWRSGAIEYVVKPDAVLTGTLDGDLLSITGGLLQLDGAGTLSLTGDLDFGVAVGSLIGKLDYTLTDSASSDVETGSFFFFNYTFAGGQACSPNEVCGDEYRLWGNNWDNTADPDGVKPNDNVLVNGSLATAHRGVDLGGVITPVPEPSAALLFMVGGLIAGGSFRRRSHEA